MNDTKHHKASSNLSRYKLITRKLRRHLPRLYDTEHQEDPIAWVKYFVSFSNWYAYGVEFDGTDLFYGLVFGDYEELGYFSLRELEALPDTLELPVERDLYFKPKPLSQIRAEHHRREGGQRGF
jgi:hypothetical protein